MEICEFRLTGEYSLGENVLLETEAILKFYMIENHVNLMEYINSHSKYDYPRYLNRSKKIAYMSKSS